MVCTVAKGLTNGFEGDGVEGAESVRVLARAAGRKPKREDLGLDIIGEEGTLSIGCPEVGIKSLFHFAVFGELGGE